MHLLVLSAFRQKPLQPMIFPWSCLDAPFGAQCFPTVDAGTDPDGRLNVSMHLLVLSAFRLVNDCKERQKAFRSQCTFWCSVLSDSLDPETTRNTSVSVSMHLLVLSAFRRGHTASPGLRVHTCLNAPFGAQCFPTTRVRPAGVPSGCLNAPFGAQCFPT